MEFVKRLFLPVEISSREYAAKIYIAALCLRKGIEVVFGSEDLVDSYASFGVNGIFLLKIAKPDLVKRLSENGNILIWHDEEAGLLMTDQRLFFDERLPQETISRISAFCHWTSSQHNFFTNLYPGFASLSHITGSPRFDHQVLRCGSTEAPRSVTYFSNGAFDEHAKVFLLRDLNSLAETLHQLSFEIRPHPYEWADRQWEILAKDFPLLRVCGRDESSAQHISRSSAIIHSGSTSSIESLVVGVPPIRYMPSYATLNPFYDAEDPSILFSYNASSCLELRDLLEMASNLDVSLLRDNMKTIGICLDSNAGERICRIIDQFQPYLQKGSTGSLFRWFKRAFLVSPLALIFMCLRHTPVIRNIPYWRIIKYHYRPITLSQFHRDLCSHLPSELAEELRIDAIFPDLFRASIPQRTASF